MSKRYPKARTIQQVMDQSPGLIQLTSRLQASQRCLQAILPLIPPPMRKAVHAGPIEQTTQTPPTTIQNPAHTQPHTHWIILADNAAVAAKLRQLSPLMLQNLEKNNLPIQKILVQILPPGSGY